MSNMSRMRPQVNEYTTESPTTSSKQQSHYDSSVNNGGRSAFEKTATTTSQPSTKQTNPYSTQKQQVQQQDTYENEYVPKTSQAHKKTDKDYKINPKVIPRPNQFDEIYRGGLKGNVYTSDEETLPPYTTVNYLVEETQNSSCRFVRSTFTKIPTDQSFLSNSSLLFGLYFQPFAELEEGEREVPKVEVSEAIFRCRRCSSYVNSKYEMTYSKANKRVAVCNICGCENDLEALKATAKSEYFYSDTSGITELTHPTVDFIAPSAMKSTQPFSPHYLFLIDISQLSNDLGLSAYVLNSISSNLDFVHNAADSYIAIATFDGNSIHFYSIDKNEEVKAYIVSDIESPFCPLPRSHLFLNVSAQRDQCNKLVEKVNVFISERAKLNETSKKKPSPGSVSGAAIAAGVECLIDNGGRIIMFTANACLNGFGACKVKDEKNLGTANENTLFIPQHDNFSKLAEKCLEKRIVVDQFVMTNTNFDLATFSTISNLTGGSVTFYSTTMADVKLKYEKLHYDLSRILSRPNYYDVKFMLRCSVGIGTVEILGPFNKKLGEGFALSSCNPDYGFAYNLRFNESLKANQRYHFQLVCLYTDNFNERYLRIFNHTLVGCADVAKIYTSVDTDTLAKVSIMKEVTMCYQNDVNKNRENLKNKIVNTLLFYRNQCSKNTPIGQLILPASVKYYPLYLNSFLKKSILRTNKAGLSINSIVDFLNKLMREPTYATIRYLYPKLYRIDDIQQDQSYKFRGVDTDYIIKNVGLQHDTLSTVTKPYLLSLTLDNIDFDCAYLCDDGEIINIFVFNQIDENFYYDLFNANSYEEALSMGLESLDEGNSNDLNSRVLNLIGQMRRDNKGRTQATRLIFLDDHSYRRHELADVLVEDSTKEDKNYVDFLCTIHEEIQKKMSG